MKIIKLILKIAGAIISVFCIYLLIIAVIPGMSVPEQPFPQNKESVKKTEQKLYHNNATFTVDTSKIHAWLYLPK